MEDATEVMLKFVLALAALRAYGEKELGLTFPLTGESKHWVATEKPNAIVRWWRGLRRVDR